MLGLGRLKIYVSQSVSRSKMSQHTWPCQTVTGPILPPPDGPTGENTDEGGGDPGETTPPPPTGGGDIPLLPPLPALLDPVAPKPRPPPRGGALATAAAAAAMAATADGTLASSSSCGATARGGLLLLLPLLMGPRPASLSTARNSGRPGTTVRDTDTGGPGWLRSSSGNLPSPEDGCDQMEGRSISAPLMSTVPRL